MPTVPLSQFDIGQTVRRVYKYLIAVAKVFIEFGVSTAVIYPRPSVLTECEVSLSLSCPYDVKESLLHPYRCLFYQSPADSPSLCSCGPVSYFLTQVAYSRARFVGGFAPWMVCP